MVPEHLTAILDQTSKGGSHLTLLLVIAIHADHRGEWVADQPTLQRRAHLGRRRVQQLLGDLIRTGDLAVTPGDGRGHRSTYRLRVGPQTAHKPAPFREPTCALSIQKSENSCALPTPNRATACTLSAPPVPPCPPFPPDPQYPLNPPSPPEKLRQETFGLAPAPTNRQAPSRPAKERKAPKPAQLTKQQTLPGIAVPALPFSPLPGKGGGSWERGGGEGAVRPLSQPQSATFRTHLLLEEHAIPLPSPAQIGLWAKTLGGIEPLLDLLRRLIHAGLATKREPHAYIHRVVLERAARPEPFPPLPAAGWALGEGPGVRGRSRRPHNPLLTAGVDDRRREQALRIIAAAKRGECW